jgi:hypothetical protein
LQRFCFLMLAIMSCCFSSSTQSSEGTELPLPHGQSVLEVHGKITNTNADGAAHFDIDTLRGLPRTRLETSTAVTDGVRRFDGFLMRDLLQLVGATGSTVMNSIVSMFSSPTKWMARPFCPATRVRYGSSIHEISIRSCRTYVTTIAGYGS